jgi:hypothetical protein
MCFQSADPWLSFKITGGLSVKGGSFKESQFLTFVAQTTTRFQTTKDFPFSYDRFLLN